MTQGEIRLECFRLAALVRHPIKDGTDEVHRAACKLYQWVMAIDLPEERIAEVIKTRLGCLRIACNRRSAATRVDNLLYMAADVARFVFPAPVPKSSKRRARSSKSF